MQGPGFSVSRERLVFLALRAHTFSKVEPPAQGQYLFLERARSLCVPLGNSMPGVLKSHQEVIGENSKGS